MNEYEEQAQNFLKKTGTTLTVKFIAHMRHFVDDEDKRDVYEVTLTRGYRSWTFRFGQSTAASGKWLLHGYVGTFINGRYETTKTNDDKEAARHKGRKEKNPNFSEPTAYDILACLTKNDVGSFDEFCSEYGYDTDSRKAEKIFNAVTDEWKNVQVLFTDEEIAELAQIN